MALIQVDEVHQRIREIALGADGLVATVGAVNISPNSRNVIPAHVHFTIDIRGWNVMAADRVCDDIEQMIATVAVQEGCAVRIHRTWREDRADFHPELLELIEDDPGHFRPGHKNRRPDRRGQQGASGTTRCHCRSGYRPRRHLPQEAFR